MNNIDESEAKKELEKGYKEAEELLKDTSKMEEVLKQMESKLKVIPKVGDTLAMLPILISLVRSYIRKEYTTIPMGTIIAVVSALLYVLTPIDLIPDVIVGAGYIDDALVIATCLKLVKSDVDEYQIWRNKKNKM